MKSASPRFLISLFLAGFLAIPSSSAVGANDDPREIVWMPFKRGYWAKCARSPKHRHAWIFNLVEGPPVVAAKEGRIMQIDHPQRILVDHGDGRYGSYNINGRWEAEVQPGQLIPAGLELADIDRRGNRKGGAVPFLNFSMRGPTDKQTHDLLFRLAGSKKGVEINADTKYLSGTRKGTISQGSFKDSVLKPHTFRPNAVEVTSKNPMFWLETGKELIYEGKVKPNAKAVLFQVWQRTEGFKRKKVYDTQVAPGKDGRFTLKATIPVSVNGACWYHLTTWRGPEKKLSGSMQIPCGAGPSLDDL